MCYLLCVALCIGTHHIVLHCWLGSAGTGSGDPSDGPRLSTSVDYINISNNTMQRMIVQRLMYFRITSPLQTLWITLTSPITHWLQQAVHTEVQGFGFH